MRGIVGLTGSPGTGKKTVAPLAGKKLGLHAMGIDELAVGYGLLEPGREGEIDTRQMRDLISGDGRDGAIVYGHLLSYVVEPRATVRVAVLRCEPTVLKGRLVRRGYPAPKVTENLEAELIGVVSADAFQAFGSAKTFEVDTTHSSPAEVANRVAAVVRGAGPPPRVDWTTRYDSGAKLRSLLGE